MSANKLPTMENRTSTENPLNYLNFRYPLRKYQQEIIELTKLKLERGEKQLHLVAPPGAGKTIIGLQLVSQLKLNSLIISPTTTIQSQWAEKLDLFLSPEDKEYYQNEIIGTQEDKPLKPITLLTYQVLSTTNREQEYLEKLAQKSWVEELISSGLSQGEAELRLIEILQNNPKAHSKEISRHITRLRKKLSDILDINEVIHPNAISLIQALRRQKFSLVIFDECHHLTDYWAAIMSQILQRLEDPIVIGLTGTPPEGKSLSQENRYISLVGEIDYQVATPALVREGGLAPFQDLVLFTSPTLAEEKFLAEQHDDFHKLIDELISTNDSSLLIDWISKRLDVSAEDWLNFLNRKEELTVALLRFAYKNKLLLSDNIELNTNHMHSPLIDDLMLILEDFAMNYLKVSAEKENHILYDRIKNAISRLGYGLTERGLRKQASPVDRVLAFSRAKSNAVVEIFKTEYRNLEDKLRAVVVTDFERMSATSTKQTKGILTEDSGGAIAVLKELLAHDELSTYINPCLVTGSLILLDKQISNQFLESFTELLKIDHSHIKPFLKDYPDEKFVELTSNSSDWEARLYVGIATKLLERGITKVLVGTRGIFGEGWDCQSLNTLIDLTTTTTPMSVKQLRGRSIRINTNDPLGTCKVANNWDVVCIAPNLEKGLNDFARFTRKHEGYFGICDDGQIECGAGHVHPSFSELTPAEVFASLEDFNQEMKLRALAREGIYKLWRVGEPYKNITLSCMEISRMRQTSFTPPHIRKNLSYKEHAKLLRANLNGIWLEYLGLSSLGSIIVVGICSQLLLSPALAFLPIITGLFLAKSKYNNLYNKMQDEILEPHTQESSIFDIARAVLSSLQQCKFISNKACKESIKISLRSDGSYRIFLDDVDFAQSQYFIKSMRELFEPIAKQPYLIPKYEYNLPETKNELLKYFANTKFTHSSSVQNKNDAKINDTERKKLFFKFYLKGRAEPRIASYHPIPSLLARSERGREIFQSCWNKYVSPGFIVETETKPELLNRYFGLGASLAQRLLWE